MGHFLETDVMAEKTTNYGWIIPAGIVLAGIYVINEIFGPSAGTQQAAADWNTVVTNDNAANQATLQQVLQTQTPTLTASEIAGMANTIFSLGQSGNPVSQANQDTIQATVLNVNNTADWYSLVASFGVKSVSTSSALTAAFSLPGASVNVHQDDLQTYLNGVLDSAHIADINIYFSGAGINASL